MPKGLADLCYDATNGDGLAALALAVKITRFRLLEQGAAEPDRDEELPVAVRQARAERALEKRPG